MPGRPSGLEQERAAGPERSPDRRELLRPFGVGAEHLRDIATNVLNWITQR
jgi:hypothetical protein